MSAEKSERNEIFLLGKRLRLTQPDNGFRPGLDSVMLAAACRARKSGNILDLGCGVGSAGFCLLSRVKDTVLTGVDILPENIKCAKNNSALNDMENRTEFLCEDIKAFEGELFDHVICNPPFMSEGAHTPSPDGARALAHGHHETTLEDWIKCAFNNVKSGGSLTMIHRADMVDKIIQALGKSFGATEIIPLWPKQGVPAKRVIIRTTKHRNSPATIHAGLILHQENGEYTAAAESILRNASALI